MGFLSGLNTAASGIIASKAALDINTQNLVNQQVSGYKGKISILKSEDALNFEDEFNSVNVRNSTKEKLHSKRLSFSENMSEEPNGVCIDRVIEDETPVDLIYDPTNPLADEEGYVEGSNVNTTKETINMMEYKKLFEVSAAAFNTQKSILNTGLKIGEK